MNFDELPPRYQDQVRAQSANQNAAASVPPATEPTKADKAAEKVLQDECENHLNLREMAYLHLSPMAREKKGWPDLVFALPGRPIAVELKSPTGKLSPEQVEMLTVMKLNGWEVYVIRSLDIFYYLVAGQDVDQWEGEG